MKVNGVEIPKAFNGFFINGICFNSDGTRYCTVSGTPLNIVSESVPSTGNFEVGKVRFVRRRDGRWDISGDGLDMRGVNLQGGGDVAVVNM